MTRRMPAIACCQGGSRSVVRARWSGSRSSAVISAQTTSGNAGACRLRSGSLETCWGGGFAAGAPRRIGRAVDRASARQFPAQESRQHSNQESRTGAAQGDAEGRSAVRPFDRDAQGPGRAGCAAPAHPPNQPGFCLWITGLPSAGKSTIAAAVASLLMQSGREVNFARRRRCTHPSFQGPRILSGGPRTPSILRIGFVASEIVKHRGAVVCAAVSPYRATRNRVRSLMRKGSFIEVFVDTPLGVRESRDVKGFYAKARAGELKGFTGVDDPYEPPTAAEIVLQTTADREPAGNARVTLKYLAENLLTEPAPRNVAVIESHKPGGRQRSR